MNGRVGHAPLTREMAESSNITDLFHEDAQVSVWGTTTLSMSLTPRDHMTVMCFIAGRPVTVAAVVENSALCLGAGPVRHLGRRLHLMYDQYIWRGFISPHRMAGGE